ncbi:MAG: T9SS type A sorting domain-containing protein [Bacteroidetes bacterium]|nr:T9SS type A sorting domain-containing protein [Bacteroidota bacterium]
MRVFGLFLLLLLYCRFFSQNPVNGFANITAISGKTLTLSNTTETYDTFEDGEYVIVMQMQDNAIGTNTTNASSFGNLGSIQSAGLYEVAMVASHTESAGLPNSVVLTANLSNTYHINTNAAVQLISYPTLGSPNYTVSSAITTAAWNGTVGGVTAFVVNGTLTLNSSITATGSGFRGGSKNTPNGYSSCDNSTYATSIAMRYAGKGEGIYKNTTAAYGGGRAKLLNGGGGGNDVNSGGGGGGNYSAGGDGGLGWVPAGTGCAPSAGGLGGLSLSSSISASRVFMGGGGGGGHENDGVGTPGGAGGGIIFIKADMLKTNSCAGISITSNGNTPANASNDGSGGAGAGGSIVLNIGTYSVSGSCPLTITSSGGNGGFSNTSGSVHGGGGGGGQGVVVFSGAQPTANVTTSTTPGNGGLSCVGCTGTVSGVSGSGPANGGVIPASTGPLPVEMLSFNATLNDANNTVSVQWKTAMEIQNNYFVLIYSTDAASDAKEISTIQAEGNYSTYEYIHTSPVVGPNYYRLKQVDIDGSEHYTNWVSVTIEDKEDSFVDIYPNPVRSGSELMVKFKSLEYKQAQLIIRSMTATVVAEKIIVLQDDQLEYSVQLSELPAGTYMVEIDTDGRTEHRKLVVIH